MHLKPSVGVARPVGQAIVENLFPSTDGNSEGQSSRIPVVGIAGSRHNAFIARLVGWLLQLSGKRTGVASSEGTFFEGRLTQKGDNTNWHAAHRLLVNRLAEAAVIQTTARSIFEEGLAYDRCQVGVVTDMDGFENLADHDVLEAEQMTRVMRTQIDVVLSQGMGVINADDEQAADMARLCDGQVMFYTHDPKSSVVNSHREAGGRAVVLNGSEVLLVQGTTERRLGQLDALRPVNGFEPDAEALLAAIATACALDISPELIAAGIKTFDYQPA
jgi:cyanophycin synthetase